MRKGAITIKYNTRVNDKYENKKPYTVHTKKEKNTCCFHKNDTLYRVHMVTMELAFKLNKYFSTRAPVRLS